MSTRKQRTDDFKNFRDNSEAVFTGYWHGLSCDDDLRTENALNVCPKGAMGGIDETLIEVFFGSKYHSSKKEVGDNFKVKEEVKVIYGARLDYRLTDKSHVICTLRPSKTDNLRPYEDGVLLDIVKEPSKLKEKSRSHWGYLVSYMRATDVDGTPKLADRIKTFWLRKTKRCFYDGKLASRKVLDELGSILRWAFTVGLSGVLIFMITVWLNNKSESHVATELNVVANKVAAIEHNQKRLVESLEPLKAVASNQESLIQSQHYANSILSKIFDMTGSIARNAVTSEQFSQQLEATRRTIEAASQDYSQETENDVSSESQPEIGPR